MNFPPLDQIIVVWDGSLASQYNLMKAKKYHPTKLIVYAMGHFPKDDPDVHFVIEDYEQVPISRKYRNLAKFVRENFEPKKVMVLLPYTWEEVEKFREMTRRYGGIWWEDFAKSYTEDGLRKHIEKGTKSS